jgi:hypothetical protein
MKSEKIALWIFWLFFFGLFWYFSILSYYYPNSAYWIFALVCVMMYLLIPFVLNRIEKKEEFEKE